MEDKKKIAVLGAGTMGTGIGQTFAMKGHEVMLIYVYDDKLRAKPVETMTKNLQILADNGVIDEKEIPEITGRVRFTESLEEAAGFLKGRHDFRCFSSGRKKKGTEKEISDISFVQDPNRLIIRITANDFLQRMPELLFGTLLETGKGLRPPGSIQSILDGTEKAGPPAVSKGLLLKNIQY